MSAVVEATASGLAAEWLRIELLAHCLSESRSGRDVDGAILARLERVQAVVLDARQNGVWANAVPAGLEPLELEVLALTTAPEAEPRIGWLYQSLQPGTPSPYPTPALIHELLALDANGAGVLWRILDDHGRLRKERLIESDAFQPYQPIRPGPGVTARLFGRASIEAAPPGAVRVDGKVGWDDLVLPADKTAMLREFLYWVQHRETVIDRWGGNECGGPLALFSGPSGTGKTFAASVLANELGWPLYRIDLGRIISKYIGETEQNLNRLFDAAHGRPMVLQFDEADSVFGKRGEIKEARDRYANLEVSHLLARVESHCGPCILTTNLRTNLDPAFVRRFQVVVEFPRPDAAARGRLWRRLLPPAAPGVAGLDTARLGRSANLTGGGIRNAALHAAFLAAADGGSIGLGQIALAVWRELGKNGRELSPVDLGELAAWLPDTQRRSA